MPAMSSTVIQGSLIDRAARVSPFGTALKVASVAFGVALTAAAAQFTMPVPFSAVPFALTPMAVLLVGAALGARLGAATQSLYLLAGIAGLDVFVPSATLPPGAARLVGPTGGFLLAYPLAAFVTGWLAERGWDRKYASSALAMVAGLAIIYLGGASWYTATITHSFRATLATSIIPFAPIDIAKILLASAILPTVWKTIRN
ncbi:MAG: biotin transporter BioY [Acidobacteria bacterium]|nr:MAG: biotin transporter BioY [Acidobacteriota bacterium]